MTASLLDVRLTAATSTLAPARRAMLASEVEPWCGGRLDAVTHATVLVAMSGDDVIGCVALELDERGAEIAALGVAPAWRGIGVGARLVVGAVLWSRAVGAPLRAVAPAGPLDALWRSTGLRPGGSTAEAWAAGGCPVCRDACDCTASTWTT